jgi:riboflavin-specific deaminase-like protein
MSTAVHDLTTRPEVAVNFAITWDGRISTKKRTPSDFSSPLDKRRFLELRATADAALAGVATIAADNMTMGMPADDLRQQRLARGLAEYPLRVLLTRSGRIDPTLAIFQHHFAPIHIFSTEQMPADTRRALQGKATLHLHPGDTVDLHEMMRVLRAELGIRRLMCEGGAQVFRSLLGANLVDEINVTLCPRIFGSAEAPTLTGPAGPYLGQSVHCRLESMDVQGGECFLRYRVRAHPDASRVVTAAGAA